MGLKQKAEEAAADPKMKVMMVVVLDELDACQFWRGEDASPDKKAHYPLSARALKIHPHTHDKRIGGD